MERSQGTTESERYLARLCERTFLSLWSYPNVFRDQGQIGDGDGKEVCDLLVVCGREIIVFSDKSCQFPSTGNLKTDWRRWYKRAIKESAKQLSGAQRWIREFPDRLYLDRRCQIKFPIRLPSPDESRFHLVVVALGAKTRCQEEISGSGSFVLAPKIKADAHVGEECQPFFVGDVQPRRNYVHVLDDVTLDIILRELDTVTDFIDYLCQKEGLIRSGKLLAAEGEENLLAYYLSNTKNDKHHFRLPAGHEQLLVADGEWQKFDKRLEVNQKRRADKISYLWDEIIEELSRHTVGGTTLEGSVKDVAEAETGIRIMAAETRLSRRVLAGALRDRVISTPPTKFSKRIIVSNSDPTLAYVFIALPDATKDEDQDRHRRFRREYLGNYCFVLAWKHRELRTIVGIARRPVREPMVGRTTSRSHAPKHGPLSSRQKPRKSKINLISCVTRISQESRLTPRNTLPPRRLCRHHPPSFYQLSILPPSTSRRPDETLHARVEVAKNSNTAAYDLSGSRLERHDT